MEPGDFRAWFETLPAKYQSVARTLHDSGRNNGRHTAGSLQLIHDLVNDQIQFDKEFTV